MYLFISLHFLEEQFQTPTPPNRVVLNYETKSKRNERNEAKRNITKRNEIY